MMTTTEKTIGELLNDLRAVIDEREQLAQADAVLSDKRAAIERELQDRAARDQVPKYDNDAITIRFDEDMRAAYDPEKWEDIVKWMAETGNLSVVQRRLSDKRVKDLVIEGVVLPDGLTLQPFVKVSVRRK